MLGWFNFRSDFIYRSSIHSFQLVYFYFIFFIATIYPVFIFDALYTVPNAPSPKVFNVLYFYILLNILLLENIT